LSIENKDCMLCDTLLKTLPKIAQKAFKRFILMLIIAVSWGA
jgi:hypothetical protein